MLPSVSSSLLTRDESTGTKGLLIFLVVLGHNSLAMEYTGLYSLLYSFHVYCFYILPFLYGATAVESCQEGKWRLLLRLPDHPWIKWLTPIAFLTIPGFLLLRGHLPGGCLYLTWSLLPIIGFCCLYPWRTLLERLSFLKFLGRHSLGIYLIHVFLYNAYLLLVPWHHPLNALLSFLITLGMTCAMVLLLNRCHLGWCIGTRPQRRTL